MQTNSEYLPPEITSYSLRRLGLRTRLTLLVLLISVPLLVTVAIYVISQANVIIRRQAQDRLALTHDGLTAAVELWLSDNQQTLAQLLLIPDVISMDPKLQKPLMVAISQAHPELFLVHVTDTNGLDVARNDDLAPIDYSDRSWFQGALAGNPISLQVLVSRTTGQPALSLSAPVRDGNGQIIGVAAMATQLDRISERVVVSKLDQTGYSYIVDATGKVIAHPNPAFTSELLDLKDYPPVSALLRGESGPVDFEDDQRVAWRAYVERLPNGWGVIVQQQSDEQEAPAAAFADVAWVATMLGLTALLFSTWFIIQRSIAPIDLVTEAARSAAAGDLSQRVKVDREDEIGVLANAFNQMAEQLQGTLSGLESAVAVRTQAIKTSGEISRRISTLLDVDELVNAVVQDIQTAFGYYHTQIYLWDEEKQAMMLVASAGDASQEMLNSGWNIPRGRGLIGRAHATRQPVLVADTLNDPSWLSHPLLPATRCEAVVPIALGEQVLGVLDIQHTDVDGLSVADVDMLQSIASQVGVALQNGRQYAATQKALNDVSIFRQFAETSTQGMILGNLDGSIYYMNPIMAKMIGVSSAEEMLGKPFTSFYAPGLVNKLTEEILPQINQSGNWMGDMELITQDGRLIPTLDNVFVIRDEAGQPQFTATVITDMTEARQAQAALERQAEELSKVGVIGVQISTVPDPQKMLEMAANEIKAQFAFYHAQVYLLNEAGDQLVVSAGAGDVGAKMAARQWHIAVNSERSLVAQAARTHAGVIVNDVRSDAYYLPNSLLPDTASEMAVPLMVGDKLLGVLDVQADSVNRFSQADVAIQTALAAQVAVALQNSRQYRATQESELLVRTIIDSAPDWIFIRDCDHRYRLVNRRYADELGKPAEDILGKNDLEVGHPDEFDQADLQRRIDTYWAEDDAILEGGEPVAVVSASTMVRGRLRYLNTIKVPLLDKAGDKFGILAFIRDISELEILRQETEQRIAEINTLYRAMSKEAWQSYQESRPRQTGFFYNQTAVEPAENKWLIETHQAMSLSSMVHTDDGHNVVAAPLKLRGDVIGALAVEVRPGQPLTPNDLALLQEMTDQIALAMESARLFEQTQMALAETETLYGIIAEMNVATSYDDILAAIARRTLLGSAQPLLMLSVFDRPLSENQLPEWIFPVAYISTADIEVAARYPYSVYETEPGLLFTSQPAMLTHIETDYRLDRVARMLFGEVFQAHSSLIIPLMLGGQMIGFLQGHYAKVATFADQDISRLMAVAGQAAITVQSRLLLEQAQTRARQEQRIRQVTAQVFNATSVDDIMRQAVAQVGQTLGLPAYIVLGAATEQPAAEEQLAAEEQPAGDEQPATQSDPAGDPV